MNSDHLHQLESDLTYFFSSHWASSLRIMADIEALGLVGHALHWLDMDDLQSGFSWIQLHSTTVGLLPVSCADNCFARNENQRRREDLLQTCRGREKKDFQKKRYLDFAQSKLQTSALRFHHVYLSRLGLCDHAPCLRPINSFPCPCENAHTKNKDVFGPGIIHWTPYTPLSFEGSGILSPGFFCFPPKRFATSWSSLFGCHHAFPGQGERTPNSTPKKPRSDTGRAGVL